MSTESTAKQVNVLFPVLCTLYPNSTLIQNKNEHFLSQEYIWSGLFPVACRIWERAASDKVLNWFSPHCLELMYENSLYVSCTIDWIVDCEAGGKFLSSPSHSCSLIGHCNPCMPSVYVRSQFLPVFTPARLMCVRGGGLRSIWIYFTFQHWTGAMPEATG